MTQGLEKNNLASSYLLSGPKYIGKYQKAKDFATSFESSEIFTIYDVPHKEHENFPLETTLNLEARSSNSITIEDIDILKGYLYQTTDKEHKIAVISDIERMTKQAINSLLKIIEEPPSKKTLFLLTTSNKDQILQTVVSRCRNIQVSPPTPEEYTKFLNTHDIQIDNPVDICIGTLTGLAWKIKQEEDFCDTITQICQKLTLVFESKDAFSFLSLASEVKEKQYIILLLLFTENYIAEQKDLPPTKTQNILAILDMTRKHLQFNVSSKVALENCFLQIYNNLL